MAKTLHSVQTLGAGASVNRFHAISGANNNSTTEAQLQITARIPGVFSQLRWKVISSDSDFTTTVRFRKNGANGNLTVSAGAAQTGVFSDTSNSDSVADGDEFNWNITSGAGTGTCQSRSITCVFAATTDTAKYYSSGFGDYDGGTTDYFVQLNGGTGITGTEAHVENPVECDGTLTKGFIYVVSNARLSTTTCYVRQNGADTAIAIAVDTLLTGIFEDTSNTASVTNGDYINWRVVGGDAGAQVMNIKHLDVSFETVDDSFSILSGGSNTTVTAGTTRYSIPGTGMAGLTTGESDAQITCPFAFTASNFGINVNRNTATGDGSATFYKGGSGTALTVSITASTTGYYEDTGNSDSVAAADTISFEVICGSGGNIGVASLAVKAVTSAVASAFIRPMMLMGVG